MQADLQRKRELIKQLNQHLQQLDRLDGSDAHESESDDDDDDESSSDSAPNYAPALPTSDTIDTENEDGNQLQDAATNLTSTLRSRRPQEATTDTDTGTATGNALFASRSPRDASDAKTENDPAAQTETMLGHNRVEQEELTDSLLSMAKALKMSSLRFQSSLESEKDVLGRAGEGLDKNTVGMDAAGKKMGSLRRMTEGKGWFARISMYVWILALYVALFAVFALPKIRW